MKELEKTRKSLTELKEIISEITFEEKNSLISKNDYLKFILFESTNYHNYSKEITLFEKKSNIILSEELKKVIEIFTTKGFIHSELLNLNYLYIECFFSLEFIQILIENGVSNSEIEEGYFDHETQVFSSKVIEDVYNKVSEKENLLIYCIPFAECCGGRSLLILNGNDANIVAYDNHCSRKEIIHNEKTYRYTTYLLHEKAQTIFDLIFKNIDELKKIVKSDKNDF